MLTTNARRISARMVGTWLAGDVVTYTAVRSPVVVPDDDPDDDPQTIRVAFRVGDDGDVFALFPDISGRHEREHYRLLPCT